MYSINDTLKDFRYQAGQEKITLRELGEALDVPFTTLAGYEADGTNVPANIIVKYADYFDVSADFILGRTQIRKSTTASLDDLHLSEKALDKLRSQKDTPWIYSEIIENDKFDELTLDAAIYASGYLDQSIYAFNAYWKSGRDRILEEYPDKKDAKEVRIMENSLIDQGMYFAMRDESLWQEILKDLREKHRKDADSFDIEQQHKDTETIKKAINRLPDGRKANVVNKKAAIHPRVRDVLASIMAVLHITPSEKNIAAGEKLLGSDDLTKDVAPFLSQSDIIEPNPGRRKYAAKKAKHRKAKNRN